MADAVIVKNSTASAPAMTRTIGGAIDVLNFVLVTQGGWTLEYSDTNRRAWKTPAASSVSWYFYFDDNVHADYAKWKIYKTMSDIDTGTDPMPASGEYTFYKASTAIPNIWGALVHNRGFHMLNQFSDTFNYYVGYCGGFGLARSQMLSDAHAIMTVGTTSTSANGNPQSALHNFGGRIIMRDPETGTGPASTAGVLNSLGGMTSPSVSAYTNHPSNKTGGQCVQVFHYADDQEYLGDLPGMASSNLEFDFSPNDVLDNNDQDTFSAPGTPFDGETYVAWRGLTSDIGVFLLPGSQFWE